MTEIINVLDATPEQWDGAATLLDDEKQAAMYAAVAAKLRALGVGSMRELSQRGSLDGGTG